MSASWDDLVVVAQNRSLDAREYRPIAELLFDQFRRRGLDADQAAGHLVSVLAFGRMPEDIPIGEKDLSVDKRIAAARVIACTPAKVERIVVWLGYQGTAFPHLSAGRISILNAHWAVPNAEPGGQAFEHKAELWELVQHGHLFHVARLVGETSEVDSLVRVDLGETTSAGAVERATEIVNTILNVSIHNAGGVRPYVAQYALLHDGKPGGFSFVAASRETGFRDDHYGAGMTADAIKKYGPQIAEALAREDLPRFLAAALEVQTTADYPFSRDMALRRSSEADITSVVPLSDRVVQHIAAYAAQKPKDTFDLLGQRWPHARWLADVQRAVGLCLLGGASNQDLHNELTREWFNPKGPWILFVADRADDLLLLCRVESERAWIERMLRSVTHYSTYATLISEYEAELRVLEARRGRVRNALVHGNPVSFAVVSSVREYAEFLGGSALQFGLQAYVKGISPSAALAQRTAEYVAMDSGEDAATHWRKRVA